MAQEYSNPYFLHSSDHPGLILVSQPLTELNYSSWSRSMRLALNSKRKLGFIDGSIPKPGPTADPESLASWECNNDIISSWLLNSISKEIAESVIYADSAATLWKDLKDRFSQANGPRLFELKKSLVSLQQGTLTVNQYFTKMKCLWEELVALRPTAACTCGGVRILQDFLQTEYVLTFLMGLNDSFSNIRGQILAMEPIPPISKVFNLILQEEKQKAITAISSAQSVVFAVRGAPPKHTDGKFKQGKKNRPLCTNCGFLGHTKDKCYKIIGYPHGYDKSKGKTATINNVSIVDTTSNEPDASPQLTASQVQQLLSLLQTHNNSDNMENATSSAPSGPCFFEGDWQG